MKSEIEGVTEQILNFPINTRAYLAELLLESLDYEEDYPISNEWIIEIKKRCRDIDSGTVKLVNGEEGLAKLKSKFI